MLIRLLTQMDLGFPPVGVKPSQPDYAYAGPECADPCHIDQFNGTGLGIRWIVTSNGPRLDRHRH